MTARYLCWAAVVVLLPAQPPADDHYELGKAALDRKDYDAAIRHFTADLEASPSSLTLCMRADAYEKKGDADRAMEDYTRALRLNPDSTLAYFGRATLYSRKGDHRRAIADYTELIRLEPEGASGYFNRGSVYREKGDYDRAIQDYTEAIRLDPKEKHFYTSRAMAYQLKKDHRRAVADCTEAIRLDPTDWTPYLGRALAYRYLRDFRRASDDYSEIIRLRPGVAHNHLVRANCYLHLKEYGRAAEDLTEAVRLDPRDASAHNSLAWLLATCPGDAVRNGKQAVAYATKACELSKYADWYYLDTLAAAYAEDGQFTEAVRWQKKALAVGKEAKADLDGARHRLRLYEAGKPYRGE